MTDADVERVARAIHHIEYEIDGGYRYDSERFGEGMRDMRRDQARAAIAALPPSARERELEEALRPFAALADRYDAEPNLLPDIVPVRPDTECHDRTYPTLGDARRARAAIAAMPPSTRERELVEALQPFALAADDIDDDDEDHYHIWEAPVAMNITVGELRNARAVLANKEAAPTL